MMRRIGFLASLVIIAAAVVPLTLKAQSSTASMSGRVSDPAASAVPNAQVQLRNLQTTVVVNFTTGPDGLYSLQNLAPGAYDLTVTAAGFSTFIQSGISLNLNEQAQVDVTLKLGTAVQKVEVSANASPLDYQTAVQK